MQKSNALLPGHGNAASLVAVQIIHPDVAVNQLQQCGLAAAVPPDHSNLLIVPDLKIDILQYGIRAVLHQRMSDLISHKFISSLCELLPKPSRSSGTRIPFP